MDIVGTAFVKKQHSDYIRKILITTFEQLTRRVIHIINNTFKYKHYAHKYKSRHIVVAYFSTLLRTFLNLLRVVTIGGRTL